MLAGGLPWKVTQLPDAPWPGFWAFNPSIHLASDGVLRCVMRCADYHAPGGVAVASKRGRIVTRNVMLELEPQTLGPLKMTEILELDELKRYSAGCFGYEDMRLFEAGGKLLGIATTLQLRELAKPEMVLLHFDGEYHIRNVKPLRGTFAGSWSDHPQKNWSPFDGADAPRFLFAIERGVTFTELGPEDPSKTQHVATSVKTLPTISFNGTIETRTRDRMFGAERTFYDWTAPGMRGGSQLVRIGANRWLGIGHYVQIHGARHRAGNITKNYTHAFYLVDDAGALQAKTDPMKLSACGIEFAAGLVVDGDRVLVSFGTDDDAAHVGETSLAAVLAAMKPIGKGR